MPAPAHTALALASGLLLTLPLGAVAQGTAPAQGVGQPMPQPAPLAGPPAPKPSEITDGRPRVETGGGETNTSPETTSKTPLPPVGQADPPPPKP